VLGSQAFGQTLPSVTQDAKNSSCSNIVALAGDVKIDCSSLTPAQQKIIESIPSILHKILANQVDAETILSKLDGCLEGIKQVREQAADWHLPGDKQKEIKRFLGTTKVNFEVHVIPRERNPSLFGMDLVAVLTDSGWDLKKNGFVSDFTLNPALVGIHIVVSHKDFPEAVLLQSALHSALGIDIPGEIDDAKKLAKEDNVIYIAIGAKPPVVPSTHY